MRPVLVAIAAAGVIFVAGLLAYDYWQTSQRREAARREVLLEEARRNCERLIAEREERDRYVKSSAEEEFYCRAWEALLRERVPERR
jgi:predicted negative regulator of RcsB-dependent stress response